MLGRISVDHAAPILGGDRMTRSTAHIFPRKPKPEVLRLGQIHGLEQAERIERMISRITGDQTRSIQFSSHYEIQRWSGTRWVKA
jgi:hypothetical protein